MWAFQLAILDLLKALTSFRITSKALTVARKAQAPLRLASALQAFPTTTPASLHRVWCTQP